MFLRRAQGWSVLILRKTDRCIRIFSYGNAKLVRSEAVAKWKIKLRSGLL